MLRGKKTWTVAVIGVLLAFVSASASAYTIYLVDGSTIIAKKKYELDGDRVLITLPSGTTSFIEKAQVDFERTERANLADLGTAKVLSEDGLRQIQRSDMEAPKSTDATLRDYIAARGPESSLPHRERDIARAPGSANLPTTRGGFADLVAMSRQPFPDLEVSAELESFIRGQGVEAVRVFEGSEASHPLLEFTANSEAAIFRALSVSASALLQIRSRFGDRVENLQLLMITPARERGGQFLLSPEGAQQLVNKELEPAAFFVRYVQF